MRAHLLILVLAAGCSPDGAFIVVTVETRPAVQDAATLRVTLSNAGSMRTEDLPLGAAAFPATFSVSPEDRTGELAISIDALDKDGALVGRGTALSTIAAADVRVMLDPTDFVINTEFADDQQLSNYFGANGFQLAATPAGTWTAVYNASCSTPCNVFGRRFDVSARPVTSVVAAGTAGFPISTKLTTFFSTPAVASNGTTTLAVWNNDDPAAVAYSIECRALDAAGAAVSNQIQLSTDEFPNLVSVAALANGNFAIAWDGRATNTLIRAAIVQPNCALVGTVAAVSPNVAGLLPRRSHVAANSTNILYAWTLDGAVRGRIARNDGSFVALDTELVPKTATEVAEYVRVASIGTGFALVVRWALSGVFTGPGRLELYRVSNTGTLIGAPTPVSDRSGSDSDSRESFGVAGRGDGAVLVAWHACMDKGDGSGCGVFGRLMRSTGAPAGPEFVLATSTANDQTGPSAVALPDGAFATAWTDRSGAAPDSSGTSVRARIIYPTSDVTGLVAP